MVLFTTFSCSPPEKQVPGRGILCLSAAAMDILTRLGASPDAADDYALDGYSGDNPPPSVGRGSVLSFEKIASLGIGRAVVWYYQIPLAENLKKHGIKIETLNPVRLETYPDLILKCGEISGKRAEAEGMAADFRKELAGFPVPSGRRIPVYFELYSGGKAAGDSSYIGDLLRCAGGISVTPRSGPLGLESIVMAKPEVIFFIEEFGSAREIASRNGFSEVPAVKSGRIYAVPRRLIIEGTAPLEAVRFFSFALLGKHDGRQLKTGFK